MVATATGLRRRAGYASAAVPGVRRRHCRRSSARSSQKTPVASLVKVLILGGYGTFGGRLAQLLADENELTLLIAGRSREKAQDFCARLEASATLIPLAFDRDGDIESALRQSTPDLVVDASGPFQFYGNDPYRMVEACLFLGVSYLDLADSSAFVDGISRFDERGSA